MKMIKIVFSVILIVMLISGVCACDYSEQNNIQNNENIKFNNKALMGGALPFTGMIPLVNKNNTDGTYFYQDMTEDGKTVVLNCSFENASMEDELAEEYAKRCATDLADAEVKNVTVELNNEYSANSPYPVYVVGFESKRDSDKVKWNVYMTTSDEYTYIYAYSTDLKSVKDLEPIFNDVFSTLKLEDLFDKTRE